MAVKKHAQLKKQIKELEIINNGYQGQLKALRAEKTSLQSNISALGQTEKMYFYCEALTFCFTLQYNKNQRGNTYFVCLQMNLVVDALLGGFYLTRPATSFLRL